MDVFEHNNEKVDIKDLIKEFAETFARLAPEERAYRVICAFLQNENPTEQACVKFYGWLLDEQNREVKSMAMERVAMEYMNAGRK